MVKRFEVHNARLEQMKDELRFLLLYYTNELDNGKIQIHAPEVTYAIEERMKQLKKSMEFEFEQLLDSLV